MGFNGLDEETYLQTIHQKETFDDEKIFKYLPNEMVDFLKYVNKLGFEEDPNYSYMKKCFEKILSRNGYETVFINNEPGNEEFSEYLNNPSLQRVYETARVVGGSPDSPDFGKRIAANVAQKSIMRSAIGSAESYYQDQ